MRHMRRLIHALLFALLAMPMVTSAGQPTKRPTDEERGEEVYARDCASCHGVMGQGNGAAGLEAPALVGVEWDQKSTVALILEGKGDMPGFSAVMDKADARRVLVWLAAQ